MGLDGLMRGLLTVGAQVAERRVAELGKAIVEAAEREAPGVEAKATGEGVELSGKALRERLFGTRSVLPDLALAALVIGAKALAARK